MLLNWCDWTWMNSSQGENEANGSEEIKILWNSFFLLAQHLFRVLCDEEVDLIFFFRKWTRKTNISLKLHPESWKYAPLTFSSIIHSAFISTPLKPTEYLSAITQHTRSWIGYLCMSFHTHFHARMHAHHPHLYTIISVHCYHY
jgi:hypothetical protein